MGFAVSGVALVAIVYALVIRLFTNDWVTGWTALFIAVLFIGGAQLLSLGIIGEYIGRIYGESKRRPLYLVEDARGFEHAYEHAVSLGGVQPYPPADDLTDATPPRRQPALAAREADIQVPIYHEPAGARVDEPMS